MQVAGVMRIMEASFRTTITRNELAILHFSILIISLSVLMFEIALTRIFSVMLSYHYVFIAVSVALFGLGIGAIFFRAIRLRAPFMGKSFDILSVLFLIFALSIPLSIMLSLKIPSTQHLIAYYAVTFVPFFFAGMIFALAFDRFTEHSSKLYSASLAGSGIGCFAVIFALESFGGISTTIFIGSILAIGAILLALSTRKKKLVTLSLIGFLLVSMLFVTNLTRNYVGDISSDNPEKELFLFLNDPELDAKITSTCWSTYGRTDLVELGNMPKVKVIFTDGGAGTYMFQFDGDNFDDVEHLKNTSAFFPFYFGDKESVLIIGPGGGADVLIALMGGAKNITAVEVNPDIVNIVREESEYNGGIYYYENVRWIIDEGRNFIKRSTEKYDIIMLPLVYTNSAREVGYSLVESYIFTVEAFDDYLNHLKDNGRLVIVIHDEVGAQRLFVTALTAIDSSGKTTQEGISHMASVQGAGYYPFPVFILKKSQFSENESIGMHTRAHEIGLQPIFIPNIQCQHMSWQLVGLATGQITLHELIYGTPYDISPTTDDSPFFYNYDEKGLPSSLSSLLYSILFLTSLVTISALVSLKYKGAGNTGTDSSKTILSTKISPSNFIFYFSFLGLGFMLIEVALVQKFILFLGQPTLTLSVLLFSLLVGGGIGSLFSDRFKGNMVRKVIFICLLIGILTISYAVTLPSVFDRFLGHGVVARSLVSAVLLFPLGFLMGMPFPTGLKIFKQAFKADVAWMWGINGAMSVMGSVLAVAIAILLGFSWTLALGALAYFCISAILLH